MNERYAGSNKVEASPPPPSGKHKALTLPLSVTHVELYVNIQNDGPQVEHDTTVVLPFLIFFSVLAI